MPKSRAEIFLGILNTQQEKNTKDEPMEIGKVISLEPLEIEIEGLPLYSNNILINPYLLEWNEEVNITTSIAADHTHNISIIHHPSKLKIGSYVYCYGTEYNDAGKSYQKYIVLEVVK